MKVRLAFAVSGLIVWGYAVVKDHQNLRLVGIVLLAISLVLRFAKRRQDRETPTS